MKFKVYILDQYCGQLIIDEHGHRFFNKENICIYHDEGPIIAIKYSPGLRLERDNYSALSAMIDFYVANGGIPYLGH